MGKQMQVSNRFVTYHIEENETKAMLINLSGLIDNRSILSVRDILLSILDDFTGIYVLDLNKIENDEFINLTNFRKMISDAVRVNPHCVILSESRKLELWIENYSIFNGTYLAKSESDLLNVLKDKLANDRIVENSLHITGEADIRLHLDYLVEDKR